MLFWYIVIADVLVCKSQAVGLSKKSTWRVRKRQDGIFGCIWDVKLTDIICKDMSGCVLCFKKEESTGRHEAGFKDEKQQSLEGKTVKHHDGALRNTRILHTANGMLN